MKAKGSFLYSLLLLLLLLFPILSFPLRPLYSAFLGSGANLQGLNIEAWAKLKYPLKSEAELLDALNENFQAVLRTIPAPSGIDGDTYLLISWKGSQAEQLEAKKQEIKAVFKDLGLKPQISVSLTGTISQKLEQKEQEQIAEKVFKEIGARKLEGISTPELVSITGYSPFIQEYLHVGNKRVNLNVALSFDEIKNQTVVHVGSPLLKGEY